MPDHDRLSSLILAHWQSYRPSMLEQLQRENQLETALEETAEQFTDLLYELVSVRKLAHHQAWEMVIDEFLLPEECSSTSQTTNPPATSESPMSTGSEWVARMKKRTQTSPPSGS